MTALFPCPCCGHSITKQDAAGFRILGPDEVDQVTLEKCAEVAETGYWSSALGNAVGSAVAAAIRTLVTKEKSNN